MASAPVSKSSFLDFHADSLIEPVDVLVRLGVLTPGQKDRLTPAQLETINCMPVATEFQEDSMLRSTVLLSSVRIGHTRSDSYRKYNHVLELLGITFHKNFPGFTCRYSAENARFSIDEFLSLDVPHLMALRDERMAGVLLAGTLAPSEFVGRNDTENMTGTLSRGNIYGLLTSPHMQTHMIPASDVFDILAGTPFDIEPGSSFFCLIEQGHLTKEQARAAVTQKNPNPLLRALDDVFYAILNQRVSAPAVCDFFLGRGKEEDFFLEALREKVRANTAAPIDLPRAGRRAHQLWIDDCIRNAAVNQDPGDRREYFALAKSLLPHAFAHEAERNCAAIMIAAAEARAGLDDLRREKRRDLRDWRSKPAPRPEPS